MKFSFYKCKICNKIIDYSIESNDIFPDVIKCSCGYNARRIFSPLHSICHQGKVGNKKNGYKSNLGKIKKT